MGRPRKSIEELKLKGTYRPHRHGKPEELPTGDFDEALSMPKGMSKPAQTVFKRFLAKATWLDESREVTARVFCELVAQFEADPVGFPTSRLTMLRSYGADLGLTDQRMRKAMDPKAAEPLAKILDGRKIDGPVRTGTPEAEARWNAFLEDYDREPDA
ncbi:hypothetical protein [Silicimonas sp. MF1-12-2]|uniref:hypothetical protein n=1 Tax=Silicimonas sp. MF1-12-2 TaxID=3384793 RepID=UPI0039B3C628